MLTIKCGVHIIFGPMSVLPISKLGTLPQCGLVRLARFCCDNIQTLTCPTCSVATCLTDGKQGNPLSQSDIRKLRHPPSSLTHSSGAQRRLDFCMMSSRLTVTEKKDTSVMTPA